MKEVSLAAIAAKLEKIDLWQIYFDTQAGAFVEFLEEYDEEASPEMTEEQILQYAFEVEDNWERYVALPNAYDIDEHSIMKNFAMQQEDLAIKEKLLEALKGSASLRHFRQQIKELGLETAWLEQRQQGFLQIARQWCLENGILYEE